MNEAIERVAAGEVTQAVRDSVAECGPIAAGDWLAISRDGICDAAAIPVDAALRARRRRCSPRTARSSPCSSAPMRATRTPSACASTSTLAYPQVEVEVHQGGQPLYPYLIGVE